MVELKHSVEVNIYLLLLPFVGIIKHRIERSSEYACDECTSLDTEASLICWFSFFYVRKYFIYYLAKWGKKCCVQINYLEAFIAPATGGRLCGFMGHRLADATIYSSEVCFYEKSFLLPRRHFEIEYSPSHFAFIFDDLSSRWSSRLHFIFMFAK